MCICNTAVLMIYLERESTSNLSASSIIPVWTWIKYPTPSTFWRATDTTLQNFIILPGGQIQFTDCWNFYHGAHLTLAVLESTESFPSNLTLCKHKKVKEKKTFSLLDEWTPEERTTLGSIQEDSLNGNYDERTSSLRAWKCLDFSMLCELNCRWKNVRERKNVFSGKLQAFRWSSQTRSRMFVLMLL